MSIDDIAEIVNEPVIAITFQEAIDKINSGIILACPVCMDGLEIDEEGHRMYCPKHGEYVK